MASISDFSGGIFQIYFWYIPHHILFKAGRNVGTPKTERPLNDNQKATQFNPHLIFTKRTKRLLVFKLRILPWFWLELRGSQYRWSWASTERLSMMATQHGPRLQPKGSQLKTQWGPLGLHLIPFLVCLLLHSKLPLFNCLIVAPPIVQLLSFELSHYLNWLIVVCGPSCIQFPTCYYIIYIYAWIQLHLPSFIIQLVEWPHDGRLFSSKSFLQLSHCFN